VARMGLLGALAGLGEGISDVGKDMARRREQALEDAKELAKEQRAQAARSAERADQRSFDIDKFNASQSALDRRAAANQEAIAGRQAAGFEHQEKMLGDRAVMAKDLATYKAGLSADNTERGIRLRDALSKEKIKGIKPGRVAKDGYIEVIGVKGDGSLKPTGQWVTPGFFDHYKKTPAAEAAGESLTPDVPEEEEDDEGWF
jgi:hypothetical protein